jgi:3-oxoacyl-[acyl-carrier-protein] synthase-3
LLPATACLVQRHLGACNASAFDLNAACTGFLYAIATGSQFIQAGTAQRVLVVAGETLSRFINWQDRNTCVLFGDGAAAVVLEATTQNAGVLSTVLGARGDTEQMLSIDAGGSARPASAETVAGNGHYLRMRGNEIFKMAVRSMAQSAQEALARIGLTPADLRMVIPHQANLRILTATRGVLGLTESQMFIDIDRFGNTGASSIPIALCDFMQSHTFEVADNILLVAFGGGLTWGASVLRWADIPAVKRERAESLRRRNKLALTG